MAYESAADPEVGIEQRLCALARKRGRQEQAKAAFFEHLRATIDFDRYREIQSRYLSRRLGTYIKFLDLAYWMETKFDQACQFGLDRAEPMRILDIGAGVGNFLYICRYFGHDVLAMDVGKVAIYDDIIALLDVPRVIGRVDPFVALPDLGRRFDLVTAFLVVFDKKPDKSGNWHEPEWAYFLRDLATNQLTDEGQVLLKISLKNYDPAFESFLARSGAEVTEKGSFVHYRSLGFFRNSQRLS